MNLRDLDRRVLPVAARAVARVRDRVVALERPEVPSVRELDHRYGGKAPLALVREVPQVGFVVIAAVLLAGIATARTQEAANTRRDQAASQTVDAPPQQTGSGPADTVLDGDDVLGPLVGAVTSAYEADAARELDTVADEDPDGRRAALVSLDAYQTPAQLVQLLGTVDVRRVYLRAKAAGKNATQASVDIKGGLLADLNKAYASTATQRATAAKEFQGYVDTIDGTSADEQSFKKLYAAFATANTVEAQQYRSGCACVFSAIVEADATQLKALSEVAGVRAVEVAGPGLDVGGLQVHPLLPEVKGTVPAEQSSPQP